MVEIIACEEHDQVYDIWRRQGPRRLKVTHVDFHCDMRGLFINRRKQIAYFIGATAARRVDPGNFLAHAIVEGTVGSVRWVHAAYGGRRYDLGTVKFETDLTAVPKQLRHALRPYDEIPIEFEEIVLEDWDNDLDGQHLDIDWDALAPIGTDTAYVRNAMTTFLARDFTGKPEAIYLVYSPCYSHPDRALFEDFLAALAAKFSAGIRRVPLPADYPGVTPSDLEPTLKARIVRGLHHVGIY